MFFSPTGSPSGMLKRSTSGVLAVLRGLKVPKRTPRLFVCCGLAWDKARLSAPGLGV